MSKLKRDRYYNYDKIAVPMCVSDYIEGMYVCGDMSHHASALDLLVGKGYVTCN